MGNPALRAVGNALSRGINIGRTNYSVGMYGNAQGKKWLEIDTGPAGKGGGKGGGKPHGNITTHAFKKHQVKHNPIHLTPAQRKAMKG
jgi:hypothetical protein